MGKFLLKIVGFIIAAPIFIIGLGILLDNAENFPAWAQAILALTALALIVFFVFIKPILILYAIYKGDEYLRKSK